MGNIRLSLIEVPMRTLVGLMMFLSLFNRVTAQPPILPITPTAEYDIGVDCPSAQTLSPDGATLWVLMRGCLTRINTLQAFNLSDGTPVDTGSADDFSAALEPLREGYVDRFTNPLVFINDGNALSIRYIENDSYAPRNLILSLDSSEIAPLITHEALTELLLTVTEYPEVAVYNADHTQLAVTGTDALTVFDLTTGEVIFSLPLPESYNAYPTFSQDGQTLYVGQFSDLEDIESFASTLTAYSLSDGEMLGRYDVPSVFVWVSPDGRYAVAEVGANDGTSADLYIVDLTNGAVSDVIPLYEPSRPLVACANDGRNMSDVDFTVSGKLNVAGLNWLPDSSGVVYTRSYGGEASGGARPCAFNTSRLNRIDLPDAE